MGLFHKGRDRARSGVAAAARRLAIDGDPETAASARPNTAAGPGTVETLGPGIRATGTVRSSGTVHVHGTVTGEVRAPVVILEADGSVEGDIVGLEVYLHGRLKGRVIAPDVTIAANACVEGQVMHNRLSIERTASVQARTPWRPLNYFETAIPELQGGMHEHVQP